MPSSLLKLDYFKQINLCNIYEGEKNMEIRFHLLNVIETSSCLPSNLENYRQVPSKIQGCSKRQLCSLPRKVKWFQTLIALFMFNSFEKYSSQNKSL